MKTTKAARAAASVGRTAGRKKARDVGYTEHLSAASLNRTVFELQLVQGIHTLRNPRIQPAERETILLSVGEILLDYLRGAV